MSENSNIKIEISPDEYLAHISIIPAPGDSFDLPELNFILRRHGVIYGIKNDVLMIILQKIKNSVIIDNILIAEGIPQCPGIQPEVDYKFQFSSTPKEHSDGSIDYREIEKILSVKKDQVLAIKKKLHQSVDGITVTGKKNTMARILDIPLRVGANILMEEQEDYIYFKAAVDGALKFENNYLSVSPTLDIKDDVDFNVGNIHFDGEVKIGRDVLPDFIVETKGNISIWGSAIACQLSATESIDVRAGIVGKNKGEVQAGGNITATFVENAKLKAAGKITIKNGIIGSNVYCDGTLSIELPRSRVVGSIIRAAKGIFICNVGSRFDTATALMTGINPDKEQEFNKIKKFLDTKVEEAKEIEKKYGRATLEKRETGRILPPHARDEIARWDTLKNEIKNILKRLKQTEDEMYDYQAVIRIKETLFPRVILTIGKHKLTTTKEYYHVTVRYSPEDERLVIQ